MKRAHVVADLQRDCARPTAVSATPSDEWMRNRMRLSRTSETLTLTFFFVVAFAARPEGLPT